MVKKLLTILAWISGLLLLLALLLMTSVDWAPAEDKAYFKHSLAQLHSLDYASSEGQEWLAGWAAANSTPQEAVDLVGYKPRGKYEFVQDSSFVKALVIGNGKQNSLILNYELLIVHPALSKAVNEAIEAAKLPLQQVYFTGTHTHSGMGGYMPGIMGKIAFGGYDENVVNLLAERSVHAAKKAIAEMEAVSITYQKQEASQFVANRFIPDGPIDPYIRQLIFTKKDGRKGTFFTYTAHATCLNSQFMGLSGDYPYYLTQEMKNDFDFALFAAGTVGSHRPLHQGREIDDIKAYAHQLDSLMETSAAIGLDTIESKTMSLATFTPILPEANYRLSDNIRLRPWVFNNLFGDTNAHFDVLQIGNTLMISSSGEISGMFYQHWEKAAKAKGLNLIITSFNGGYMGYIVPDQYYNRSYFEARDMNWFGPYSGSFYDQIISSLIKKTTVTD